MKRYVLISAVFSTFFHTSLAMESSRPYSPLFRNVATAYLEKSKMGTAEVLVYKVYPNDRKAIDYLGQLNDLSKPIFLSIQSAIMQDNCMYLQDVSIFSKDKKSLKEESFFLVNTKLLSGKPVSTESVTSFIQRNLCLETLAAKRMAAMRKKAINIKASTKNTVD